LKLANSGVDNLTPVYDNLPHDKAVARVRIPKELKGVRSVHEYPFADADQPCCPPVMLRNLVAVQLDAVDVDAVAEYPHIERLNQQVGFAGWRVVHVECFQRGLVANKNRPGNLQIGLVRAEMFPKMDHGKVTADRHTNLFLRVSHVELMYTVLPIATVSSPGLKHESHLAESGISHFACLSG